MYFNSRKYIFSKKYARRCIIRTLLISLLLSSLVLIYARVLILGGSDDAANAKTEDSYEDPAASRPGYVAITFDDSPSENTLQIVALLDSMDITAAFFITGINVQGHEDCIERICTSGHDIGNHTWDYTGIGIKSARGAIEDVVKTEDLIQRICNRATPFVRPPYNSISTEAYSALYGAQYRIIYYDIDSDDFFNRSKQSILDSISNANAGDIIRFHDGKITPDVLREVIKKLREMGLEPVALSTLLSE